MLRINHRPILRSVRPTTRAVRTLRSVRATATLSEVLIAQSEIIGKGLTLFVLFTASLNYLYYRRIRIEAENLNKQKENSSQKEKSQKEQDV